MSSETTPAAAPVIRPSPAVVNALLKWSAEDRLALGQLLLDSVREGFTSLEEVEQRDKVLIRSRLEDLVSGKVELLDADDVVADLERRYAEKSP